MVNINRDIMMIGQLLIYITDFAIFLVSFSPLPAAPKSFSPYSKFAGSDSSGSIQDLSLRLKRKNRLATPKAPMATAALSPSIRCWSPMVPWEPLDRGLLAGLKTGAAALNCRLPRRAPGLHSGVGRRSKLDEVPMSVLNAYLDHGRWTRSTMEDKKHQWNICST